MIKITDIVRGITEALEKEFNGISIVNKQLTEGSPRPCFYINVDNVKKSLLGELKEDEIFLSIYYIESETGEYLELLKKLDTLDTLFNARVEIAEGFYIYPQNMQCIPSRPDMVLQVTFDFIVRQQVEDTDNLEYINEYEIKFESKEV